MCVVRLARPLTSVLQATLLLFSDGLSVMPPVTRGSVSAPTMMRPGYILGRNHPIRMVTAAPGSARWWVCGRAIDPGVGGALEVGRWRRKRSHI